MHILPRGSPANDKYTHTPTQWYTQDTFADTQASLHLQEQRSITGAKRKSHAEDFTAKNLKSTTHFTHNHSTKEPSSYRGSRPRRTNQRGRRTPETMLHHSRGSFSHAIQGAFSRSTGTLIASPKECFLGCVSFLFLNSWRCALLIPPQKKDWWQHCHCIRALLQLLAKVFAEVSPADCASR